MLGPPTGVLLAPAVGSSETMSNALEGAISQAMRRPVRSGGAVAGLSYGGPVTVEVRLCGDLVRFVPARLRNKDIRVAYDGTSSLGHVVESIGVPLTEVGALCIDGHTVPPAHRLAEGDVVEVDPVTRPQAVATSPPRFLLDVHLGALARWLRVLGVDTAYDTDADDEALVSHAVRERRVLLTKDRGLLRRRALPYAAYVRGSRVEAQLTDVLDRFEPPLAPYTRCPVCNGTLTTVAKDEIAHLLEPGTRRSYDDYARCTQCRQIYWPGAHARRLDDVIRLARARVSNGTVSYTSPDRGSEARAVEKGRT
jgi:uncharacterized protein